MCGSAVCVRRQGEREIDDGGWVGGRGTRDRGNTILFFSGSRETLEPHGDGHFLATRLCISLCATVTPTHTHAHTYTNILSL